MYNQTNKYEHHQNTGRNRTPPVQIGVGWAFDIQVPATNVVKCFIVVHDGHVGVLQQRMHAQHLRDIAAISSLSLSLSRPLSLSFSFVHLSLSLYVKKWTG